MRFEKGHEINVGSGRGQKSTPQINARTDEQQDKCDRTHAEVAEHGRKAVGGTDLRNYLAGKRLNPAQSIRAKCYSCNGYGELSACSCVDCPLYPFFLAFVGDADE